MIVYVTCEVLIWLNSTHTSYIQLITTILRKSSSNALLSIVPLFILFQYEMILVFGSLSLFPHLSIQGSITNHPRLKSFKSMLATHLHSKYHTSS
mmetsp:Transcript_28331/g.42562  ORF Transcript_28331/g.42562 Transcript_28331/m.42562 type:complete len:95 (-) Transcript_28331:102-386(-)